MLKQKKKKKKKFGFSFGFSTPGKNDSVKACNEEPESSPLEQNLVQGNIRHNGWSWFGPQRKGKRWCGGTESSWAILRQQIVSRRPGRYTFDRFFERQPRESSYIFPEDPRIYVVRLVAASGHFWILDPHHVTHPSGHFWLPKGSSWALRVVCPDDERS